MRNMLRQLQKTARWSALQSTFTLLFIFFHHYLNNLRPYGFAYSLELFTKERVKEC